MLSTAYWFSLDWPLPPPATVYTKGQVVPGLGTFLGEVMVPRLVPLTQEALALLSYIQSIAARIPLHKPADFFLDTTVAYAFDNDGVTTYWNVEDMA